MYLNKAKMAASTRTAKFQMVFGVIFLVFFGFGIVGGLLDYSEGMRDGLLVYIVLVLPFIWLIYLSVQKKKMREMAMRLNQSFSADADGNIPAGALVEITKSKNELQAVNTVEKLIGKGYLCNCAVEYSAPIRIVLYKNSADGNGYTTITCPNCGASTEKRVGFSSFCPFCNSKIN